jgi:hypothetical protein
MLIYFAKTFTEIEIYGWFSWQWKV